METSRILPNIAIPDDDACTLLPIPATDGVPGGVLVLGGQSILYFEVRGRSSVEKGKGKETGVHKGSRKSVSSVNLAVPSVEPLAQVDWPLSELTAWVCLYDFAKPKLTIRQLRSIGSGRLTSSFGGQIWSIEHSLVD